MTHCWELYGAALWQVFYVQAIETEVATQEGVRLVLQSGKETGLWIKEKSDTEIGYKLQSNISEYLVCTEARLQPEVQGVPPRG